MIRSWWPLASTWSKYAAHPQWTENYNKMFEARASELKTGNAQPLSAKEWRGKLRDIPSRRALSKKILTTSQEVIENYLW